MLLLGLTAAALDGRAHAQAEECSAIKRVFLTVDVDDQLFNEARQHALRFQKFDNQPSDQLVTAPSSSKTPTAIAAAPSEKAPEDKTVSEGRIPYELSPPATYALSLLTDGKVTYTVKLRLDVTKLCFAQVLMTLPAVPGPPPERRLRFAAAADDLGGLQPLKLLSGGAGANAPEVGELAPRDDAYQAATANGETVPVKVKVTKDPKSSDVVVQLYAAKPAPPSLLRRWGPTIAGVLLSAGTSIYALIESRSEDSLKTTADRSCGALTQFCVDDTQAWGETRGRAQVARWAAVALASGTLAVWMVTCVF